MGTVGASGRAPAPAGFDRCPTCAYLEYGTPAICYACFKGASAIPTDGVCAVCCGKLQDDGCGNPVCGWGQEPKGNVWYKLSFPRIRFFDRCGCMAYRANPIERVLNLYKFGGKKGWAPILARILVGHLDSNRDHYSAFDLIIALPKFVGKSSWDHMRLVLQEAAKLDSGWPLEYAKPWAVTKTTETDSMKTKTWHERHDIYKDQLLASYQITNKAKVTGKAVLVVDDIFTSGSQSQRSWLLFVGCRRRVASRGLDLRAADIWGITCEIGGSPEISLEHILPLGVATPLLHCDRHGTATEFAAELQSPIQ